MGSNADADVRDSERAMSQSSSRGSLVLLARASGWVGVTLAALGAAITVGSSSAIAESRWRGADRGDIAEARGDRGNRGNDGHARGDAHGGRSDAGAGGSRSEERRGGGDRGGGERGGAWARGGDRPVARDHNYSRDRGGDRGDRGRSGYSTSQQHRHGYPRSYGYSRNYNYNGSYGYPRTYGYAHPSRDRARDAYRAGYRDGYRDERGRVWNYDRGWYDRYRAERWAFDRGRWYARTRFSIGIYVWPSGYSPRLWYRGEWLPRAYYYDGRYRVHDYDRFDLYEPPFGAGWVRSGDDALLIDIDSGEILDVVYSLFR
jgi:Ni/Co efflux regulator RcnB